MGARLLCPPSKLIDEKKPKELGKIKEKNSFYKE